jgi:hypothetical protein
MLAVGVHDEHVCEAGGCGGVKAIENRGAFTPVALPAEDAKTGIPAAHLANGLFGPVGAAIDDDPHRLPMTTRLSDGG